MCQTRPLSGSANLLEVSHVCFQNKNVTSAGTSGQRWGVGRGRAGAKQRDYLLSQSLGLLPTYLGPHCTAQRTIKPSSALSRLLCAQQCRAGPYVEIQAVLTARGTGKWHCLALQMVEQELQLWG